MRILIVGGTGTIGNAVAKEFSKKHELIIAGFSHGDIQVNLEDPASIQNLYQNTGKLDAVISTAGKVHFAPLETFSANEWSIGLNNKLMGQVHLVTMGLPWINDRGSFTLTSGILSRDPIRMGSAASMVNGALDSFVKAAAIELPRGLRINAVSPTVLEESMDKYADFFQGFIPVPVSKVVSAYMKSVEGGQTGQVYSVE